jgi:hypothetical protein
VRSKNEITLNSIFSESSPTQAARRGFLTLNFRLWPFLESWCCVLFLHSCVAHFAVENLLPFCFAIVSEHIFLWRICFRLDSRLFRSLFFLPEFASTSYIIVALLDTYRRMFSPPMITHYNGLRWTTLRYRKRNIPLVKQHVKSTNLFQFLLIASSYIVVVLLGVAEFKLKVSLIYEIFRQESWLSRWWINEQVSLSTQMQMKNISTSSDNIGQDLKLGKYLYSLLSCFHPAACPSRVEIWCINLKRQIKSSQNSDQTKFLYSKNPQKPCM